MNPSVSLITTFLLILSAAIGGSVIAARIRLPPVVGYIAGGIIIGNTLSHTLDHRLLETVSEAGVTLLLFALGVEFSFHRLRRVLRVVTWPAVAQIILTMLPILLILVAMGTPFLPALYLGSAAALSSTAIVIKILSERGELDTAPGELTAGWLVLQDLAVIPILILLSALSGSTGSGAGLFEVVGTVLLAFLKSGIVIGAVLYLGSIGVPRLLNIVAAFRNRELFLLTTIGIVFFVGIVTYTLGLSVSLGAFLAGLLVAETSQNHAVFAEIRPLRDLFAVVFFVSLGLSLPVSAFAASLPVIVLITVAVFVLKSGIIFALLRFLGYHRKTSFLVALNLSQVSEFGFILAATGVTLGALTSVQSSVIVAVTFLTIMGSSPVISNGHAAYYRFAKLMKRFPKFFPERDDGTGGNADGIGISDHVVICGYGRVGKYIGRALEMAGVPFLVVDYNQHSLHSLKNSGILTVYGDPADKDVLDFAQVDNAKSIVIAIPDRHTQELIIANALSLNRRIKIICRTHHEEDQRYLKSLGVQTVIQPEFEAALAIVSRLLTHFGVSEEDLTGKMARLKIEHGIG